MSQSLKRRSTPLNQIFFILLGVTLTVWILRGFAVLAFIPGGSLLVLIILTIITGVLSRLPRQWLRF